MSTAAGGAGGTEPPEKAMPLTPSQGESDMVNPATLTFTTLSDIRTKLTELYGQEKGDNIYTSFMQSVGMALLIPLQQAQQSAQQAAKEMMKTEDQ